MKKIYLVFAILFILSDFAAAQTLMVKTVRNVEIGEKAIVKDSSGRLYPYPVWTKLLASGDYQLRSNRPASDSTEYLLVKTGNTQKKIIQERKASYIETLPKPAESIFFTTGQPIKSFSAKAIDGYKFKLKDMAGKVVVLNFWFIGCPPCRQEIPELNKIANDYANNPNVVFVAIGLDYKADIEEFLKDKSFNYHIVEDGRMYSDLYRLNLYPTNVVLDKEGKVRFHGSGYAPNTPFWIRKTIEEALRGSD